MKSTPPPNWLIIGSSAIIIGISAALAGLAFSGILSWNQINMLGGWTLLPFPLAVGSLQYAAGFRQKAWAATVVGVIHLSACGLVIFACISSIGEHIFEGGSFSWDICEFLFVFLCLALCFGFCGWMDMRVGKYLRTAAADGSLPDTTGGLRRYQFTSRELLGAIVVVSIMASVAGYTIRNEGKQFEEHITREASPAIIVQLPEGATDICYCRGIRRRLVYEFTIDEAGFLKWAESQQNDSPSNPAASIDKILKGKPATITRYTNMMPDRPPNEDRVATITQGYFYECSSEGHWFLLAYDSVNQRAYYYRY